MSLEMLGAEDVESRAIAQRPREAVGRGGHGGHGGGHGFGRGFGRGFYGGGPWPWWGYPEETFAYAVPEGWGDDREAERERLAHSIAEKLAAMKAVPSKAVGLAVVGAADEQYGPLSPEQLSNIDRALTPAEQKAVDDWQSSQASRAQAAEEQKGGPKATIVVRPKGALVSRVESAGAPLALPKWLPFAVAGSIAVVGLGATIALLAKAKWGWALANFFLLWPAAELAAALGLVAADRALAAKRGAPA